MLIDRLSCRLYESSNTQELLNKVEAYLVSHQFSCFHESDLVLSTHELRKLIIWGSVFAKSSNREHNSAALRISHYLLEYQHDPEFNFRNAAAVILNRLGLDVVVEMAIKRNFLSLDHLEQLPPLVSAELLKHDLLSFHPLPDGTILFLNKFQSDVIDILKTHKCASISAPTSAGKSYIILRWIESLLAKKIAQAIVYLVPTRALIQQVQSDLQGILRHQEVAITSIPVPQDSDAIVYILTQERFHMLLSSGEGSPVPFDLIVIDEAQKIGDKSRGILLEQVITSSLHNCAEIPSVVFLSPMTENPEILTQLYPDATQSKSLKSDVVTVNQNVIWVRPILRKPKQWVATYLKKSKEIEIGKFDLFAAPGTSKSKRLAFVASSMAGDLDGNLIYVDLPSQAENIAKLIKQIQIEKEEAIPFANKRLQELIKLIRSVVHPKYDLAEVLKYRIAFHYGNMPLIIRSEIEELFKSGVIRYLVCTSTLIEGVNLPAKNVFIDNPKKGKSEKMQEGDFWNLAGRAGRMGKEFQGNIVCLEPDVWNAPKIKRLYSIKKQTSNVLQDVNSIEQLIFSDSANLTNEMTEAEYTLSYLISKSQFGVKLSDNKDLREEYSEEKLKKLESILDNVRKRTSIPESIINRNPGINPVRMQRLYDYFVRRETRQETGIADIIPAHVDDSDAYASYVALIKRMDRELFSSETGKAPYLALLALEWMRGKPLALLINRSIQYFQKIEKKKNLSAIIRDVMSDVEGFVRFRFIRNTSCYVDVLEYYLSTTGKHQYIKDIPRIGIWLEFGASQATQLSLIGLGLSRVSAIMISEHIARDDLSEKEALEWLKSNNVEQYDFSAIVLHEIMQIVGNIS